MKKSTIPVFVYGTLMRGHCNHHWLHRQTYQGPAVTAPCYRLHDVGRFPGMVASDDGYAVEGEIWAVDSECLERLNVLEGVDDGEYEHAWVDLRSPKLEQEVLTYLWLGSVKGCPDIGPRWERKRERLG